MLARKLVSAVLTVFLNLKFFSDWVLLEPVKKKKKSHPTSLHTSMVPNTTCRPSKKLSPMMMTVAPPVVHPSLGLIALMHGVAAYPRQRERANSAPTLQHSGAHVSFHIDTLLHHLHIQPTMSLSQSHIREIAPW